MLLNGSISIAQLSKCVVKSSKTVLYDNQSLTGNRHSTQYQSKGVLRSSKAQLHDQKFVLIQEDSEEVWFDQLEKVEFIKYIKEVTLN